MADRRMVPWDWLSAQQRLGQGRVSDPSQDRLSASSTPDWQWQEQRYRERQTPGLIPRPEDVEAVPFGSLADPVSQAAFLAAPGMVRGSKALLETMAQPGPSRLMRGGMLAGERGNLGPPPVSATGEALPESMVRDETGQLQRLYHGTSRVFPDFDMAKAGSGAGGDLYGPGIYMTSNPEIAGGIADIDTLPSQLGYATSGNSPKQWKILGENLSKNEAYDLLEQRGLATATAIDPSVQMEWRGSGWSLAQHIPDTPNVRPVYADLKKPFDIEGTYTKEDLFGILRQAGFDDVAHRAEQLIAKEQFTGSELYYTLGGEISDTRGLHVSRAKEMASQALQGAGYDGITHMGGGVTGGQPHRVFISFSPESVYPSVNVDALRTMSTQYPPP